MTSNFWSDWSPYPPIIILNYYLQGMGGNIELLRVKIKSSDRPKCPTANNLLSEQQNSETLLTIFCWFGANNLRSRSSPTKPRPSSVEMYYVGTQSKRIPLGLMYQLTFGAMPPPFLVWEFHFYETYSLNKCNLIKSSHDPLCYGRLRFFTINPVSQFLTWQSWVFALKDNGRSLRGLWRSWYRWKPGGCNKNLW
jgi:hypothetical protein